MMYLLIWHVWQMGSRMAIMKKGNQQKTNAPVIIASVLAAFLSLLDSAATFFLRTLRGDASNADRFWHDGSTSKPLWKDVFSGDVLAELAVVNAVVVVVVVGSVKSSIIKLETIHFDRMSRSRWKIWLKLSNNSIEWNLMYPLKSSLRVA